MVVMVRKNPFSFTINTQNRQILRKTMSGVNISMSLHQSSWDNEYILVDCVWVNNVLKSYLNTYHNLHNILRKNHLAKTFLLFLYNLACYLNSVIILWVMLLEALNLGKKYSLLYMSINYSHNSNALHNTEWVFYI